MLGFLNNDGFFLKNDGFLKNDVFSQKKTLKSAEVADLL